MIPITQIKQFTFILFLAILASGVGCSKISSDIIATVNGESVSVAEFEARMPEFRATVVQYFRRNYKTEYCQGFWTTSYGGEIPGEILREQTLDKLVEIKLQQILAREKGLLKDISYTAYLKQWQQENEQRKIAMDTGKVIFGPVNYDEQMYFRYFMSKVTLALKQQLAEQDFKISDDALWQYYEKKQSIAKFGTFENQRQFIKDRYIDEQYEALLRRLKITANININEQIFRRIF